MLIYFDECYDSGHIYLILGALFNPKSKTLHKSLLKIKKEKHFIDRKGNLKEIKYRDCYCKKNYDVSKEAINAFLKSKSWFCAIVIKTDPSYFSLDYFGRPDEPEEIKKARAYKKFAELLIAKNARNLSNAVLLADKLTRCRKDRFVELMKDLFSSPGMNYCKDKDQPILGHIAETPSHLEQFQVLQICDLLTGCILNNLIPTKNKYKNMIRKFLIRKLQVRNLLKETWEAREAVKHISRKFRIWYWQSSKKRLRFSSHQR